MAVSISKILKDTELSLKQFSQEQIKNLEKRMEDVKNRYGYYPQAKYDKNTELKTYFEKLKGKDLNTVLQ